jgi:hypothetical protein
MDLNKYTFINEFYIKKPSDNCGSQGIDSYNWFIKRVETTPELMLRCPYCKKVYWTKIQNNETVAFMDHKEKCSIKKKNIEYKGNIIMRS